MGLTLFTSLVSPLSLLQVSTQTHIFSSLIEAPKVVFPENSKSMHTKKKSWQKKLSDHSSLIIYKKNLPLPGVSISTIPTLGN